MIVTMIAQVVFAGPVILMRRLALTVGTFGHRVNKFITALAHQYNFTEVFMFRPKKTSEHLFKHAQRRARERYGLWLTQEDHDRFIGMIQKGECQSLGRESFNRTHFLIDDQFIVVYDKPRKAIATFLPPEAIYNYLPLEDGKVRRRVWSDED